MKKKEKLILGQKKDTTEDMKFYDPGSRPAKDVETDLNIRNTPFAKIDFPKPPDNENYSNYEEFLASEEYKSALDKLAEITGKRNIGVGGNGEIIPLSIQSYYILQEVTNAEKNHKNELIELCKNLIIDYFKIPNGKLNFDFKLGEEKPKITPPQNKNNALERDENFVDELNDLTPERAKRRLLNAMTQGHAVDSSYIFKKVSNELKNIIGLNNIIEKYSIIISTNLLSYWQFDKEDLSMVGSLEDMSVGKSRIDTSTRPPTIHATGMIFPVLVHEAIKGVMEFLSIETNPENPEKTKRARDLEDKMLHEIWDIRIGPQIWKRLRNLFPQSIIEEEDKKKIQYYIYTKIVNLPVNEFLILMKEVIENSQDGKRLISSMYYDLTMVLDDETHENQFRKTMNDVLEKHKKSDNNDINDILKKLGFTLN